MAEPAGPAFLDTNVLVYSIEDEEPRRTQAQDAIGTHEVVVVSAQVISEFVNTCLRKRVLTPQETYDAAAYFMGTARLVPNDEAVLRRGLAYHGRYGFQWWDALVVAAAVEAQCPTLYSEDMQDGQLIDGTRIVNPFREPA